MTGENTKGESSLITRGDSNNFKTQNQMAKKQSGNKQNIMNEKSKYRLSHGTIIIDND